MTRKFFSIIAGIFIFAGLPILGWGLNDLSGFFSLPARLYFVVMMAILSVLVVLFVPEEGRGQGKGEKPAEQHKWSLLFLQVVPVLLLIVCAWSDRHGVAEMKFSWPFRFIGLCSTFLGFLLMNWSVLVLGKQFSVDVTIQKDHQLVNTGPYSFIRHPRYLGILIFFKGISHVFLSWIGISMVVVILVVLIWRIRDEEELMFQEFQEEWVPYRKKTWVLIPFIY